MDFFVEVFCGDYVKEKDFVELLVSFLRLFLGGIRVVLLIYGYIVIFVVNYDSYDIFIFFKNVV